MSYTINKLSAIKVRSVTRPGLYGDGGGLWLQVSTSGSKSWIFRYDLAGRRREMGLGSCITVDLALAREKARECRLLLLDKRDPLEERDRARSEHAQRQAKRVSFDECAASYIDAHRGSWKSAKHAAQWETTLAMYTSPVIGKLPVADVDTDLIVKVLSPIWKTKTETATRLRGRIESILDWAATRKLRHDVNPARWRGHLENLLANPNKIAPVKNHPALPWRDVGSFMSDLRQREGVSARAIEFAILTACRSGEVRGATWDEIDLEAKLWTIPAGRMKAGKEHRVPLSTGAIALLRALERRGRFVFPGRDTKTTLSDMSLTAVLRRMGRSDITVHGFRSTFRDWCSEWENNSFPREVCEHALAHNLPDKVEAAYRRGDLLDKRVILMQAWADYCAVDPAPNADGASATDAGGWRGKSWTRDLDQAIHHGASLRSNGLTFPFNRGGAMTTAKTTAERQAAYRARQACGANDGQKRVNLWLSTGCALALARLAKRHGITQREFVEKLVLAEDDKVLASMALDSPEWSAYFQVKPMRAKTGATTHPAAYPPP